MRARQSLMGNRIPKTGQTPVWTVDQLPPLIAGDLLAFKAAPGFEQWAVDKQGALTWHWAMVGEDLTTGIGRDYEIIGSINKGVAVELLSAYEYRQMRIYRPGMELTNYILRRCAYYGAYDYNWLGVAESAVVYLLRELGLAVHLPEMQHRFYCIQFVCRVWADLGVKIVPDWEYATPADIEIALATNKIWGTF